MGGEIVETASFLLVAEEEKPEFSQPHRRRHEHP
jgi:hypothetical protein